MVDQEIQTYAPRMVEHRTRLRDIITEAAIGLKGRRIATGVAAMIVALAVLGILAADLIGQVSTANIDQRLEQLRARWLSAYAPSQPFESDTDYDTILDALPFVEAGGMLWRINTATIATPNGNENPRLIAASPGAVQAMGAKVAAGRLFDHGHANRGDRVALIGPGLSNRLGMNANPGALLEIDGEHFTVIGVLNDVDSAPDALLGIVIPAQTAIDRWPPTQDSPIELLIEVQPGTSQIASQAIPVHVRPTQPNAITITTALEPESLISDVTRQLRTLLWWAALTLSIIGTATIGAQLAGAVHQRRAEIGLRRALGAKHHHILGQFLLEGVLIASIGAALGLGVGVATAVVLQAIGVPVIPQPWYLLLIPGALITGLIAAAIPARRGAQQDPATALRSGA